MEEYKIRRMDFMLDRFSDGKKLHVANDYRGINLGMSSAHRKL